MNRDPLLYPVFDYLRRHGVPIGVSEYIDAVRTVRAGVMLKDSANLKRLCQLLWAKSLEDQELVEVAFARFVEPRFQRGLEPRLEEEREIESFETSSEEQPPDKISSTESRAEQESASAETTSEGPSDYAASQAISLGMPWPLGTETRGRPYQLVPRFPLRRREVATAWRHLRQLQRTGPPEVLDVQATIDDICQTGVFLGPILRPKRRNRARLVLLIDRQGSMAPFAPLMEVLVTSIERGGLLGRVSCHYFHDCPGTFLYDHPALTGPQSLEKVLAAQVAGAGVLIVSDAGAARGTYDSQRVKDTQAFLRVLNAYTYTYVWLNPLPPDRWEVTTAEDIADLVPMFPLDRDGLNDAVNILRGHPFPPEVNLDAV